MSAISIQSFIYDGYVFYYTDEAIEFDSNFDENPSNKTIGFYFDLDGFPQRICIKSSFGCAIMRQYNLRHPHQII